MGTTESDLSQDIVFDILSSTRRRYVLYYLRTTDGPVRLTDLAEEVAAWENETDRAEITDQERKRVYVSLYQTHIPRLAEAGLVNYDKDSGQIELAEGAVNIDRYLDSADDSYPWQRIYVGLAVASAGLLTATALFNVLPNLVAATIVIAAFVLTAGIQTALRISNRRSVPDELSRQR